MTFAATTTPSPRAWLFLFALWSVIAGCAAAILPAPRAPVPVRLFIIVGPVVTFALALGTSRSLRQLLARLNSRWLVAGHGIRFVIGAAFLMLGRQGLVPWAFALHAGIGDLIAGAGALLLTIAYPRLDAAKGRSLLLAWNVVGIVDFINVQRVVSTFAGRQDEFVAMRQLPMALVPYWGVPLLWSIHVYLVWRYFAQPAGLTAPAR